MMRIMSVRIDDPARLGDSELPRWTVARLGRMGAVGRLPSVDSLGDVGAALAEAKPTSLSRLYQQLRLQLRHEPHDQAVFVTAEPRVDSARVRGGTCTLTTRLSLGVSVA
jgi:hypothetical protein